MDKRERIISLVTPSAHCLQGQSLACVFEKFGYRCRTISVSADIPLNTVSPIPQVLFLSDRECLAKLASQIRDWPEQPRLAIFSEGIPWDFEILKYCAEAVTWPCTENELLFRVEQTFSSTGEQATSLLSDVFLRLNMIGNASSFLHVLSLIQRIARYDATILINGETGTGKELVARALHYMSACSDGPFIAVNCGGIPDELFENELFGHALGAYTDARSRQLGYVEQANGGSLFLDEIDALSLKSQTTLLRFLQDQFYKPLGSEKVKHANIRLIAATNANLRVCVEAQQFRQDLLFRLDVLSIDLPSLRERSGDAALLAEHFIDKFSREYDKPARPLHPEFLAWMQTYDWPGNIRELENTVLRAFLLSEGMYISRVQGHDDKLDRPVKLGRFNEQKARAIDGFERQYLDRLLIEARGNVSLAAKLAGKERRALGKLLQKHGINRLDYIHCNL